MSMDPKNGSYGLEDFPPLNPAAARLTILPSGDAVRACDIRAIRLRRAEAGAMLERPLFSVVALLVDGDSIELGAQLSQAEAQRVARNAAQAVNKALKET
ncbi:MAG: hypothetical protein KTR21_16965 [Rhodobacteraceae bacterium]|nr:hypothetical protein [Paracoccaceae bacterium]